MYFSTCVGQVFPGSHMHCSSCLLRTI